eukprot:gene5634-4051_t
MNYVHHIQGVVIMKSTGGLFFAKYYTGPNTPPASQKLARKEAQRELESTIFNAVKGRQSTEYDITLTKDHNENAAVLLTALRTLLDTLVEFKDSQCIHSRHLEDNYELLILAVDEMIDDGVLLEVRPAFIAEAVEEVNVATSEIPGREMLTQLNKMFRDN